MSEERVMNDPWCPQHIPNTDLLPKPPHHLFQQTSEQYISSLENKLNRLRGRSERDSSRRDLLSGLSDTRVAHMDRFTERCDDSAVFDDDDTWLNENPTVISNLQRRLQPEKQALNTQELKPLVEHDELQATNREDRQTTETTTTP